MQYVITIRGGKPKLGYSIRDALAAMVLALVDQEGDAKPSVTVEETEERKP